MLSGFVLQKSDLASKRAAKVPLGIEDHLPELSVMLSLALHYLADSNCAGPVKVCPDGQHLKSYPLRPWLEANGFTFVKGSGKTDSGGEYHRANSVLIIRPSSGEGDVTVPLLDGSRIHIECKGGVLNSTYAGNVSRLRRALFETVGHAMSQPQQSNVLQIVAVPDTKTTRDLAFKMLPRVTAAGIKIALVNRDGVPTLLSN